MGQSRLDARNRSRVEGDDVRLGRRLGDVDLLPAFQMCQQPRREPDGRLALVRLARPFCMAIEDRVDRIDPRQAGTSNPRGPQNGTGPRSRVDVEQQEPAKMAERSLVRLGALLDLARAPASPEQSGYLATGQPALTSFAARG